ncbi:hypothetical protein Pfo_010732 [Paulownia fortunei]|nr:hypothetical protein Pfo_010732 [Paulownia fortunei]
MENHHFLLKVSHLFPQSFSSCQFRTLPDVAEPSITFTKPKKILHENDLSPFLNKPHKENALEEQCKETLLLGDSFDAEARKCPPVNPISTLNSKEKVKPHQECKKNISINQSSSSNSGWFSSSDEKDDAETDTFFSLSSNSGDPFRLKIARRRMKTIDELGRCSLSSAISFDTVVSKCSRRKTRKDAGKTTRAKQGKKSSEAFPEYELGSDHISAKIFYSNHSEFGTHSRRKTAKTSRKIKKNSSLRRSCTSGSWMIEESCAVEKSSSDPYSDFRASMVEMIVEKQLLGAQDLERLLICFLTLNEVSNHGIIVDVFSEICETLFSN